MDFFTRNEKLTSYIKYRCYAWICNNIDIYERNSNSSDVDDIFNEIAVDNDVINVINFNTAAKHYKKFVDMLDNRRFYSILGLVKDKKISVSGNVNNTNDNDDNIDSYNGYLIRCLFKNNETIMMPIGFIAEFFENDYDNINDFKRTLVKYYWDYHKITVVSPINETYYEKEYNKLVNDKIKHIDNCFSLCTKQLLLRIILPFIATTFSLSAITAQINSMLNNMSNTWSDSLILEINVKFSNIFGKFIDYLMKYIEFDTFININATTEKIISFLLFFIALEVIIFIIWQLKCLIAEIIKFVIMVNNMCNIVEYNYYVNAYENLIKNIIETKELVPELFDHYSNYNEIPKYKRFVIKSQKLVSVYTRIKNMNYQPKINNDVHEIKGYNKSIAIWVLVIVFVIVISIWGYYLRMNMWM